MQAWLFNVRGRLTDGGLVMLNAPDAVWGKPTRH